MFAQPVGGRERLRIKRLDRRLSDPRARVPTIVHEIINRPGWLRRRRRGGGREAN